MTVVRNIIGAMLVAGLACVPVVTHAINPTDLAAFVDGFVEARRAEHDIVGVSVSIVHQDRMIFAKGYGYADAEKKTPVVAAKTLFRPGSISKTLTWTAVMQLYEQGKIDLTADIREYLPNVDLNTEFDEPITMLDLMAHRPGFEENALGHLFVATAEEVTSSVSHVNRIRPRQVRPPATLSAYSNYGTTLAGIVVSNVAEQPFEQYIEQHILAPLDMNSTTFLELGNGMPEALAGDVSRGHIRVGGRTEQTEFVYLGQTAAAGSLSTTATDMAKWMLAHLNDGAGKNGRILSETTARQMHSAHYSPHPLLPGSAHGFFEIDVNGHRGFGHGGGTVYFFSGLVILPSLDFGLFISTNTRNGGDLLPYFAQVLVGRYFDTGPHILPALTADADTLAEYAGSYVYSRRNHSTVEKVSQSVEEVVVQEDGLYLPVRDVKLVAVADDVFQSVDWPDYKIAFIRDDAGHVTGFAPSAVDNVAQKATFLNNTNNVFLVIGLGALALLCVVIAPFVRNRVEDTTAERMASWLLFATAFAWIIAVALVAYAFTSLLVDQRNAFFSFPSTIFVNSLGLVMVATVMTAASVAMLAPVWRGSSWSMARRVRHTTAVIVAVGLAWLMYEFNLIGFNYH